MSLPVPGLKIKNNKLLSYNATSKEWEEADTQLIPAVEELLKKISQVQFQTVPLRQGLILEDQYDLGTGQIKAYKDIDGDMQMTFEARSKEDISIDEDAAFNQFQTNNKQGMDKEVEPVNYWGGNTVSKKVTNEPPQEKSGERKRQTKKVEKENSSSSDSISALGNRKRLKISEGKTASIPSMSSESSGFVIEVEQGASGEAKPTLIDRIPVQVSIKGTTTSQIKGQHYKKRESNPTNNKRQSVLKEIKMRFLKSHSKRPQGGISPDREYTSQSSVKFMSKGLCRIARTYDPGVFIGMLRYNSKTRTSGNVESKFFLEDVPGPN